MIVVRQIGTPLGPLVPGTIYRNQTILDRGVVHRNVTLMLLGPATYEEYIEHVQNEGYTSSIAGVPPDDVFWKVSVD